MLPYWTAPLAAAIGNLATGLGVLWSHPHARLHGVFAFLTLTLALWNLDVFCLYFFEDRDAALWWSRLFRPGMFLAPAALYHFVAAFREHRTVASTVIVVAGYAVGALFIVADFHGVMIAGLRPLFSGYWPVMQPLYNAFICILLVSFVVLLSNLVEEYRTTASPRRRTQARFWLLGSVIALPLASVNLLPLFGIDVYPVGSLGNLVSTGIVAYAIVHHRLVDTDVVITKIVGFVAAVVLVVLPAGLASAWLDQMAFGSVDHNRTLFSMALMLATALGFSQVVGLTEEGLAQTVFREKAEHRAALVAFSREAARISVPAELVRRLTAVIRAGMDVEAVRVTIADTFSATRDTIAWPVDDERVPSGVATEAAAGLARIVAAADDVVVREELMAGDDEQRAAAGALAGLRAEAVVPLRANGRLLGSVLIGRKASRDAFSREELQLLATLGNAAAIALDNARLSGELETSQRIVARASRLSAVGTLAAGIAHEIRNPLVAVQTFLQLLPERLHDEEFLTSFRRLSLSEIGRIGRLIEELLNLTRSPVHAPEPCAMRGLVNDVVTLLEPQARRARVRLETIDAGVPAALIDIARMKQVFMNLLLNAIQASPPECLVTICIRAAIGADGQPVCRVEVHDEGTGIPPERRDDVFTPFFTTKDAGSGLGLAVAHQIVTEHAGEITFVNRPGGGTTFVVSLPLCAPEERVTDGYPEVAVFLPHGGTAA